MEFYPGGKYQAGKYHLSYDFKNGSGSKANNYLKVRDDVKSNNANSVALLSTDETNSLSADKWYNVDIILDTNNQIANVKIIDTDTKTEVLNNEKSLNCISEIVEFEWQFKRNSDISWTDETSPMIDNFYFGKINEISYIDDWKLTENSFSGTVVKDKELSNNLSAVVAYYDVDNTLEESVISNFETDKEDKFTCSVENSDDYKLFIWNFDNLSPVTYADSKERIIVMPFKSTTNHMKYIDDYLNDTVENCEKYCDSKTYKDASKPISFNWYGERFDSYVLKISENENMQEPWIFNTEKNGVNVYNLKINTPYYYTIGGINYGLLEYESDVKTVTVECSAPRMLRIDGVINARDIGGWKTTDGKTVKQGKIYRTYNLDYEKDSKYVRNITDWGIEIFKNQLGVKTEIDFRLSGDNSLPSTKTSSVLGEDVNYYKFPINYNGDYLASNISSIKNVFNVLTDETKYPITYHCIAGADRTGMITYLINGLLGVSKDDLLREYSLTNFSNQGSFRNLDKINGLYVKTLDEYTGSNLQEKIYNYLKTEVGISESDLNFIINYLKE